MGVEFQVGMTESSGDGWLHSNVNVVTAAELCT